MLKTLKEILIYILLIALISLMFGIIFYDKLPTNKLVPSKVEYTLPEKMQEELEQTLAEDEDKEVIVTYTVEEKDLDNYENNNKYDPGKIDPFSDYGDSSSTSNTVENNNTSNTVGNNNSSNTGNGGSGQLTETKPGK